MPQDGRVRRAEGTDGGSVLPVVAVAVLGGLEGLQGYAVSLLTPEIAADLKVGAASIVTARLLALMLSAVLPVLSSRAAVMRRSALQRWSHAVAALGCGGVLLGSGVVTSTGWLVGALCLVAVVAAPSRALQRVAVLDVWPGRRMSSLSLLMSAMLAAQVGFALVVATTGTTHWVRALQIAGGVVVLVVLLVVIASLTAQPAAEVPSGSAPNSIGDDLGWTETFRSWRATPTLVGLAMPVAAIGALSVPFDAMLSIYLRTRWHLTLTGAATVFMIVAATSLVAVAVTGRTAWIGRSTRGSAQLVTTSWLGLAVGCGLIGVGVCLPTRTGMVALVAVGSAGVAAVVPMLGALGFDLVPDDQRSAMAAAITSTLAIGAGFGVIYATAFDDRHGPRSALVALAALGVVAAAAWRATSRGFAIDHQRAQDRNTRTGQPPAGLAAPLLECSAINFSYGSLQVLFDVDITVDEGEVVALLGTNGAGKSTLLNVISGIALPQSGTVRLSGRNITYLDAETRVRHGVTQIPGGRAVFGSMSVVENLRSFGYTLGRDRRSIDEAIDRCLSAFPRLAERRTALAATLSGGEQQMLGLSKALILKPQLLLIDELSLGLAPVVVGPLLDMVRRINADGTAVVIVEQSVNIALSLVDHACFMEKGSIRFNGPAADLLDRDDLLRAVFLEGAAKAALG